MEYKDYYKILGVNKNATEKEIRDAFRRLARKYHPDVNPGDKEAEAKFKEINEAYEVLSDPEKRKRYDQLGANWKYYEQWQKAGGTASGEPFDWSRFGFGGAPGGVHYEYRRVEPEDLGDIFGGDMFSDFFRRFFGDLGARTTRSRARAPRGRNLEQPVEITLEEAFAGTTRIIQVTDASGRVRRLEVKIPAGVQEGSRVRVAGQGEASPYGGPAGDLELIVHILPHPTFERKGDDLYTKISVPLTTAILGGEVEVPTLKGRVLLKIPSETQNGRVFRLRGQGMPRLNDPTVRGDLYAEVKVVLPEGLSPRERELFEELARLRAGTAGARR